MQISHKAQAGNYRPKLLGKVEIQNGNLLLSRGDSDFGLEIKGVPADELADFLNRIDGTHSVDELILRLPSFNVELAEQIIGRLDELWMLSSGHVPNCRPGMDVLLELEDLTNDLLYKTLYRNIFWTNLRNKEITLPVNVLYGMAIENYHFLFRESYFDAPVLSFPANTKARVLMNEFYVEEFGHDNLLLKALNSIGITGEDIDDTLPLPETMALCNALAFWSRYDPLFFFSTLGTLEGKDIETDSYLEACDHYGLDEAFIGPIRAHSQINIKQAHGNLGRLIFRELDAIDDETVRRLRSQTYLFIELYNAFYEAIWIYYSNTETLLRRVSAI